MASELADRIRAEIGDGPNNGEIRMFGGTCFTLNGNMMIVARGKGGLLVRVGEIGEMKALKQPGVERMVMRGREMIGYVTVPEEALDDPALRRWIAMASAYVGTLPPKQKKPTKGAISRKQSA
jgi:TfoX/Sxy family transcriptional regulator of competence genes